ncbi:MAG: acetyl-CoA carboxylase, biotin carboxyl carrier protein [Clostridiaceae bacterium]|jgi:acetyl-CoA carboxylase biotin carboxyl carrier protein|nr:acetyl-CoA carboxylase, biotin carboxyl carrier protein [Clostridiaceae bacterium]
MELKELQEIINTMSESKLSSLEIEWEGVTIRMKKNGNEIATLDTIKGCVEEESINENVKSAAVEEINVSESKLNSDENLYTVKSPMVGTFYTSPGEGKDSFINIGDKVKKGQTLCIIEAMKLMNEIECDADGEVVEVIAKNGQMVEYGQNLIKIKQS